MTIITRPAEVEDIPAMHALAISAQAHEQLYRTDALEKAISSENLSVIVADSDGEIVGLCKFGTPILEDCDCEDLKLIHDLLVLPDWSWDTIADELLYGVEDSLNADANIQRIAVYVDPAQRHLIQFYAEQGFHHEAAEDKEGLWYMELML